MIITMSGKAEHGKDFTAIILKEKLEAKGKKVLTIHYADLLKYIAKQYLDWDGSKDEKGRTLLQWLGTEKVRSYNTNYWVNFVMGIAEIFLDEYDYFLIPDTRFPNEIELWKDYGWDMCALHIERLNYENHLTPNQRLHRSETALDGFKFDYYIKTETGIDNYTKEVNKFIEYLEDKT